MEWHDAVADKAVVEGEPLGAVVNGMRLVLFRLDDGVFALHDLCSHGQALLSDGFVEDGCVECPLHQGLVDIRTGAARSAPITEDVRSFPVRVRGGRVEIAF